MYRLLTGVFGAGLVGWGFFAYENTVNKAIVAFGDASVQLASPVQLAWLWGLGVFLLAGLLVSAHRAVKRRKDEKSSRRVERAYGN